MQAKHNAPARIAVTGAAGQIGYALLFRLAAGALLGRQQPIILQLLEIPQAVGALKGVAMELEDCAFPRLHGIVTTSDPAEAFRDADYAFLVGARPRGPGMERSDLLQANAEIFRTQGRALDEHASREVRVVVVGNPANTNALIALRHAPNLPARNFTAMTRLDHNRALAQIAAKAGCRLHDIRRLCIWGNHSSTQYPDVNHALIGGQPAWEKLDTEWLRQEFIPRVSGRGAEVIKVRGASSAASAANAALEHIRDWATGSAPDDWVSMGVPSDGSYGIPEGLVYSYPVTCKDGDYSIVPGLEIDSESRQRLDTSQQELEQEREAIRSLLPG